MSELIISQKRRLEIVRILCDSIVCGSCGGVKKLKMSHCRQCYFALPPRLRQALYQGFGCGYEEAYEESLEWLEQTRTAKAEENRVTPLPGLAAK